jgi:GMP synthase-like glutamine amidotransferase
MGGGSSEKRFGVLLCADDSEYVKKKYGGYFGVFVKMLAEKGEIWDVFKVASGEFPDEDRIGDYDGFVITGSCNDADSNDVWICKLISLLKDLDSIKKKVLGICFGHQILCRALGGKTGRAVSGWDIGVTTINLSSTKFLSSLQIPTNLPVIECHRDEVIELPPKAEVIAWSSKTGIEMFRYGEHMMGIQGHPEYTRDILLHLIDRLLLRNYITDSFAEKARAKAEERETDCESWRKLCVGFLKGV